jgi:hypothetical protein
MGHGLKLLLFKERHQPRPITHVGFYHFEIRIVGKASCVGSFPRRVIIVIKIVEANDRIAPLRQPLRQMAPNKPGRTGYEYFQVTFPRSVGS